MRPVPTPVAREIVACPYQGWATRQDIDRWIAYQRGEHRHDAALCVEEGCARCARPA